MRCKRLLKDVGDKQGHRVVAGSRRQWLQSLQLPWCEHCCAVCRERRLEAAIEEAAREVRASRS